jgi:tetratricopeptide (TPR) repeat protein
VAQDLEQAMQLREGRRFKEAISILDKLRMKVLDPVDLGRLSILEANCYLLIGDFTTAASLLNSASLIGNIDDSVRLGIAHETARLQRVQGKKKEALRHIGQIIHDFRDSLQTEQYEGMRKELSTEYALLLAETGQYDKALPLLVEALRTNPHDSDVMYCLGVAYFNTGQLERAREYFGRLIDRSDLDSALLGRVFYMLAYSHYKLGAYAQAITVLERFESEVSRGEIHRPTYEMLADCFQKLGDESKAAHYREIASRR